MGSEMCIRDRFETTFSLHDTEKSGRPSLREKRSELVLQSLQAAKATNEFGIASSSDMILPVRLTSQNAAFVGC